MSEQSCIQIIKDESKKMMDETRHWGQACRMTHKERRNRSPRIMPKRQTEGEREKKNKIYSSDMHSYVMIANKVMR